jgi:hypothetical protein
MVNSQARKHAMPMALPIRFAGLEMCRELTRTIRTSPIDVPTIAVTRSVNNAQVGSVAVDCMAYLAHQEGLDFKTILRREKKQSAKIVGRNSTIIRINPFSMRQEARKAGGKRGGNLSFNPSKNSGFFVQLPNL